jgi:hypothetical protein
MILAQHIGTDGWAGVPNLFYNKKVSISQNSGHIDETADVNVLCLLESDLITPTFTDEVLNRFDLILTWREDVLKRIKHSEKFLYGTTWVEEFTDTSLKENKLSFFTSIKLMTSGHAFRHQAFNTVRQIPRSVYDIEIHSIISPPRIDSKNSVLDSYKFSIVMENSSAPNYFTEKIIDCFATKTIPIYWGCTNIGEYFDSRGIITFNNVNELSEIVTNLSPQIYDDLIQHVEKNLENSRQYYSLWDRIDISIKKYLGMD